MSTNSRSARIFVYIIGTFESLKLLRIYRKYPLHVRQPRGFRHIGWAQWLYNIPLFVICSGLIFSSFLNKRKCVILNFSTIAFFRNDMPILLLGLHYSAYIRLCSLPYASADAV